MITRPKREDFFDEETGEYVWPNYRLKLHAYAKADRADILAYSEERYGEKQAAVMQAEIHRILMTIKAEPFGRREGKVEGTYENTFRPFIAVHVIRPPDIAVLRVLHMAQRWPERQLIKLANAKKLILISYP